MTNKEKIREEAAKAARIVKTWPAWKQNLLVASLTPTNSYCRVPLPKSTKSSPETSAEPLGSDHD